MKIEQIRVGMDNLSYIVHCERTGKAAIIDPGANASGQMRFIGTMNLELICVFNTHHHLDHTADNGRLRETYGCEVLASEQDAPRIAGITRRLSDSETLQVGEIGIQVLLTPGHTPGSICLLANGSALFTGDTLFIGDCGRTDMPGGSDTQMFASLQRLKSLPDDTIVYPGHDYGHALSDTIGGQKLTNKTLLAKSVEELSLLV